MKKRKIALLATLGIMTIACKVDAATLVVGNDSTTAGAPNRSVSVELKDDDLKNYSGVEFQLTISGTAYAELGSYSHKITSLGYKPLEGGKYFIGCNDKADCGELFATTIGSISYSTTENLNGNFKIEPTNVKFYKKDGTGAMNVGDAGIKATSGTITYEKIKSKDASLTNLTVSQGSLSPEFAKDTTEYTVVVKDTISTIRITPTAAAGANVVGGGSKSLALGENDFELVVTAEDGKTKNTYKIVVVRGEISEPSAYLKSLTINNIGLALSPDFDSKNNKYTVKIDEETEALNFKYETEDPLAEVTIEGNENFKLGENLITITVKSSDEALSEVYEITAILEEEQSTAPVPVEEKKDEKKKETKWWLIALIVGVILLVVIGISFMLFKTNKKKKELEKKLDEKDIKRRVDRHIEKEIDSEEEPIDDYNEYEENVEPSSEDKSITEILKDDLYEDEATRRFDSSLIKEFHFEDEGEEAEYDDKTKEFNFKDFQ